MRRFVACNFCILSLRFCAGRYDGFPSSLTSLTLHRGEDYDRKVAPVPSIRLSSSALFCSLPVGLGPAQRPQARRTVRGVEGSLFSLDNFVHLWPLKRRRERGGREAGRQGEAGVRARAWRVNGRNWGGYQIASSIRPENKE